MAGRKDAPPRSQGFASGSAGDGWQDVGGDGAILVLSDENPMIEGVLKGIRPSSMYPDNKLFDFETEDGPVALAGSTALNARISEKFIGEYMRVRYTGMATGKSGRRYKDFLVQVPDSGNGQEPPQAADDEDKIPF